MAKEFTVTVSGDTESDVELALEEVLRLIKEGYLSGQNSNENGEYSFTSTGEYERR